MAILQVMQLFTIGLEMLHENGTVVVDASGNTKETYDNADIQTLARAWTGFGQ